MGTSDRRYGNIHSLIQIEKRRMKEQKYIDSIKNIEDRKRHGQYATPAELAREIAKYGVELLNPKEEICFLEPAIGTGAFYTGLLSGAGYHRIVSAVGFELDKAYACAAQKIWNKLIDIKVEDFTKADILQNDINLLLSNPPYVRHHYISVEDKAYMTKRIFENLHIRISGLAGLYCYFILLAHQWLKLGAISGWLIPSEFMDVNYGEELKWYLLNEVHLLRIHRYEPENLMFRNAMVSSAVVWFKNEKLSEDYEVEFTFGGEHSSPKYSKKILKSTLEKEHKWTRFPRKEERLQRDDIPQLKDFFSVKRGLATGDNSFFILTREQIEKHHLSMEYFLPILPSPRYLTLDKIDGDSEGCPKISNPYFLLNCSLEEENIRKIYPELWEYLQSGVGTVSKKYLCRTRKSWYKQEIREPAPILCTYMGRKGTKEKAPFRFILNNSKAIATNSYLMLYPNEKILQAMKSNPSLMTQIWNCLNEISSEDMEGEGRVYGGGLKKIEPKELSAVKCRKINELLQNINLSH